MGKKGGSLEIVDVSNVIILAGYANRKNELI
jgi:hypothetical protein